MSPVSGHRRCLAPPLRVSGSLPPPSLFLVSDMPIEPLRRLYNERRQAPGRPNSEHILGLILVYIHAARTERYAGRP